MLDDTSRFDGERLLTPRLQRARGAARATFKVRGDRSVLDDLRQSGAMKIRLPRVFDGGSPEAVLINTAGGLTGGDVMSVEAEVAPGASATLTTQACERVYRSAAGAASVTSKLVISEGGRIDWLPQETILFDGGRLDRRLEVDMVAEGVFLAVEGILFGRAAMGERVRSGLLADRWRIRVDGKLRHAEALWLADDIGRQLDRAAVLDGAHAMATVLLVAPGAAERLDGVRGVLDGLDPGLGKFGASALAGRLVCRVVAPDGVSLRKIVLPLVRHLRDGRELPKVWAS